MHSGTATDLPWAKKGSAAECSQGRPCHTDLRATPHGPLPGPGDAVKARRCCSAG